MPKAPSLSPKRLPSRPAGRQWCVNVPPELSSTGERQRLFFANKIEAENECERLKTRRVNFGHSLSSLSAARIAEASACFAPIGPGCAGRHAHGRGYRLSCRYHARTASVTMATLWDQFIASKTTASPPIEQKLKSTANRLDSLRDMMASDITRKQIEEAIAGFPPLKQKRGAAHICGQRSISGSARGG